MTTKILVLALLALQERNLVKNPGFEEGDRHPAHWSRCDGLTQFWEKDEQRGGKCLRLYTRICNEEYHARLEEMKLENPPPPKPPREIKGIGYDTVGGNDGVVFWSDWIDVQPGRRYTLKADVRSGGGVPKIFVKGYTDLPLDIDDNGKVKKVMIPRVTYKIFLDCAGGPSWKTSSLEFCPTHSREDVRRMRVMIFAYWPPENYWFDNIGIFAAGMDPDAPRRWAAAKEKAKKEQDDEKAAFVREAKACLAHLRAGIERYRKDTGAWPPDLGALLKDPGAPQWRGPYVLELSHDPWDTPYKYKATASGYTLKSFGPDAAEGGDDDVE
jgi:hypothetical protein